MPSPGLGPAAAPPSPGLGPAVQPVLSQAAAAGALLGSPARGLPADAGQRRRLSSTAEEGYNLGLAPSSGPGPARKRWASISDDEASPMLWPMRSPGLRARRSHSSTPLAGPSLHQGGAGTSLARVVEHQAAPSSPFMLPHAHPATTSPAIDPNALAAWGGMYGPAMAPMPQQPVATTWTAGRTWNPYVPAPGAWMHAGGYPAPAAVYQPLMPAAHGPTVTAMGVPMAPGAAAGSGAERAPRALGGWTVVWVGERAFRAAAAAKERVESIGFLLKVYRSHDRCCRALDKKAHIAPTNVFLLSRAEAEPMLRYLCGRGAGGFQIVVDAEGSSPAEVQHLISGVVHPPESSLMIAYSWDEVLATLAAVSMETNSHLPAPSDFGPTVDEAEAPEREVQGAAASGVGVLPGSEPAHCVGSCAASDAPWTLVWISDQAFKPAATALKAQLEGLGCQVKGYKTHRNAARALDKKRALARTVVLVSGAEAAPFLAYLSARPEIASTRVVVEASARAAPVPESPTCQVVESFDAAVVAVWKVAADPGFV